MSDTLNLVRTAEIRFHGDFTSFGIGKLGLDFGEIAYLVRHADEINCEGTFCRLTASLDGVRYRVSVQIHNGAVIVHGAEER